MGGPSQGRRFTALQHAVPSSLSLPTRLYCARSCRAQAWTAVHMASTQRVACSTRTQAECWGCRVRAGRSLYHRSCCLELCYPRRTRPAAVGWVVCKRRRATGQMGKEHGYSQRFVFIAVDPDALQTYQYPRDLDR